MFKQIATALLEDITHTAVETLNEGWQWARAWHTELDAQDKPDLFVTVHVTHGDVTFDLKAWNGFGWDAFITPSFGDAVNALTEALTIEEGIAF